MAIFIPCLASSRAIEPHRTPPPPVTTATLPSKFVCLGFIITLLPLNYPSTLDIASPQFTVQPAKTLTPLLLPRPSTVHLSPVILVIHFVPYFPHSEPHNIL